MISEVFITLRSQGAAEQIAVSAIEAARAGSAVVHIHVRNPETRGGSWDLALYRAVVHRLWKSDVNPVINLIGSRAAISCSVDPTRPCRWIPRRTLRAKELDVRPEFEVFDTGHLVAVHD